MIFCYFILYFNFVHKNNNDKTAWHWNWTTSSSCRWPYYLQQKSRSKKGHPSQRDDYKFDKKTEGINVRGVAWNIGNSRKKQWKNSTRSSKDNNNGWIRSKRKDKRESGSNIHRNIWIGFWVCPEKYLLWRLLNSIQHQIISVVAWKSIFGSEARSKLSEYCVPGQK